MDYRYLSAFLSTARHLSFSLAAKELHIAQSAISRQIQLLEQSMKCQLFVRSPKSTKLTPSGQILFENAAKFDDWVQIHFNGAVEKLRIGTLSGQLDAFLVSKISEFPQNSQLNLSIEVDSPRNLIRKFEAYEIDACIINKALDMEGIICKKLFDEDMYLISKHPVDLKNLLDFRWVHMGSALYYKEFTPKSCKYEIVVNSITAVLKLVEAGVGIGIVPKAILSQASTKLWSQKLAAKGKIYFAYWELSIWPKATKEFFDFIQKK